MVKAPSRFFPLLLVVSLSLPALAAKHKTAEPRKEPPALSGPIILHVDLTDAPRHILHAHEQIPVGAGPLELQYPKWIPGNHRPTGPIDNFAGLFIRANGNDIPWRRDEVDMYGVHLTVPEGVTSLDVSYDFLAVPGDTGSDQDDATSANMAVLEWNAVVLYPAHIPAADIPVTASITVPEGWKSGTALTPTQESGNEVSFKTVSLYTLVDSPLITGRYFREIPLAPEITPKHYLDVAGEAADDVDIKPAVLDSFSRLVREASTLYQSHHYETYHFILSLSDTVRGEGLEHHESSDNGILEHGLSDESLLMLDADLLPHEFTHPWNGKYRRPIGPALFLLVIELIGAALLSFFGVSLPIMEVAGGLVLAAMGWSLLNQQGADAHQQDKQNQAQPCDIDGLYQQTFYPLTFPITVGPGCIVIMLTLSAHASTHRLIPDLFAHLGILIAVIALSVLVYFAYAYAPLITQKISAQTARGVVRVIAFLLLCIGVQIAWNGVSSLVLDLMKHR